MSSEACKDPPKFRQCWLDPLHSVAHAYLGCAIQQNIFLPGIKDTLLSVVQVEDDGANYACSQASSL